jgi:geranylgeranylglycerol-phosphate geranylgeranyltransferase
MMLQAPAWQAGKPSIGRRLTDLVILVRLPSCIAGGVSVLLGIHLATARTWPPGWANWSAVASMCFAVAAANAVNDVLDIDIDAVGKPGRPLPSGRLSIRSAQAITGAVALAAVISAVPLGMTAVLWVITLLGLAFLYSYRAKNTVLLGNSLVALCASSPIVFGAVTTRHAPAVAWIAAGLSFTFMLSYETLKTISDRDSDAASGVHTFATWTSLRTVIYLLRCLIAVLTIAACTASAASSRPLIYLAAIMVTFVIPAWCAVVKLGRAPDSTAIKSSVFLMRSAWFLGIIALWLLR